MATLFKILEGEAVPIGSGSPILYTGAETVSASDPTGSGGTTVQDAMNSLYLASKPYNLNLTGVSGTVVLNPGQYRSTYINLIGVLSSNITIEFPAFTGGVWELTDVTMRSGYTISVKKTGGSPTVVVEGDTPRILG